MKKFNVHLMKPIKLHDRSNLIEISERLRKELRKNIQNPQFVKVEEVLRLVAIDMGANRFAEIVGKKIQDIQMFIRGESPTRDILDDLLRPFGLETVISIRELDPESDDIA